MKIIAASHYDIGGVRDVYEDRVEARELVQTAGGLKLTVAAVADGVGGENKGERAAQTAIDAFYSYLSSSKETNIPKLLTRSVQHAGKAVYGLQRETGGASTTLTVAVVNQKNQKLFVANVGDSRVYLLRKEKLTQLTIDHSFANVMPWRGQISADLARNHPRAGVLMRALGPKEQVEVDLGFYVGTTDYKEANERGWNGLPLTEGDAVLVCSDGLIKDSPVTRQPLIKTEEIVNTLRGQEGQKAAKELISFTLGRGPDDNISAAIIQMPDRWRAVRARRGYYYAGGVILILVCALISVFLAAGSSTGEARATAQALAEVNTATAEALGTIAAYTPTPSNTPTETPTATPTLRPFEEGQFGVVRESDSIFTSGSQLEGQLELVIFHKSEFSQAAGHLFTLTGTVLRAGDIADDQFSFTFGQGSEFFIETGQYIRARLSSNNVDYILDGACSALDASHENQVIFSCYAGNCSISQLSGEPVDFGTGSQVVFDLENMTPGEVQDIPVAEGRAWANYLPGGTDASNCVKGYLPTPTPRPTATRPGATARPEEPTATRTQPPPTTVVPPTSTRTPLPPTPTSTPKPPTPTPTNQPPTANFTFAIEGLNVSFSDTSTDPDGQITSWNWSFGHGSHGSDEQNPSYNYPSSGTYNVTLTVRDNNGASDDKSRDVEVSQNIRIVIFPRTPTERAVGKADLFRFPVFWR